MPHQDRPLLGIALMLGFCVMAPLGDSVAKILGGTVPLLTLVAARFVVQAALLLPVLWVMRLPLALPGWAYRLTLIRTVLHILGIAAMFSALQYLPLADAVAIAFVMPFLMLLLGRYVLHEEVGARRLAACVVGFIGTLLVIQPSFAAVGWPALLPLGVAVCFALFMLVTRQLAKAADPIAMQCVSGLMASVVLVPAALLFTSPFGAASAGTPWGMLFLLGVLGTLGHLLMSWSLRFAPASTLAPMQYLEIPIAALVGLAVFGDFPNGLALFGIAVTIASGLYIIHRERLAVRSPA